MYETHTSKHLRQNRKLSRERKEYLEGTLEVENTSRKSINEVDGNEESIRPENLRNFHLKEKSKGDFQNMAVFSFSYIILLWSIGTCSVMYNTMRG